jgi:hypothetical protein
MLRVSYWNDCHGVIYLLVNVQLIQSSLRWSKVGQKELALVANVWLPCGSSLCHVGQVAEIRSCWHQQLLLGRHVVFWWYHLQARRFTQYNQSPKHDKSSSKLINLTSQPCLSILAQQPATCQVAWQPTNVANQGLSTWWRVTMHDKAMGYKRVAPPFDFSLTIPFNSEFPF